MSTRSLLALLVAVLAVAVAAPAESRAAEPAEGARAKGKRLVVSPRAGQVVHWHHVRLRVRSRTLTDTLRVRLNGTQIGDDFDRPRRGVRALRASLSHGLRRGRNVLRVTVRPSRGAVRTARVRFTARTKRHLVGAGRDRPLAVGGKVRIRGDLASATRPSASTGLRWKLVRAPRRNRAHAALLGAAPPHTLTSTAGKSAGFRPRVPGSYTLRLSAGSGSRLASDTVTLDVAPRSKLVPIETMTAKDAANGDQRGIRIGDTTYLLRDAKYSEPSESVLQVLVLKRDTLEFVSNTKYLIAPDLRELDERHLVILVLQPGGLPGYQYGGLNQAVARIGAPDMGDSLPKNTGLMSAVGVPGMARGDADVNIIVGGDSGRVASMKGYLTPDQWGNYGFVPSEREPFSFKPSPSDPCTPANNGGKPCDVRVGFRVRHLDGRTGAPAAHDGEIYSTNGRNLSSSEKASESRRLLADLTAVPQGNVVMLETVSIPFPRGDFYWEPIGPIDRGTMSGLAQVVASLGGTRNGFNRIAFQPGSTATGGLTYALVGWKGAGEGAGEEVGYGLDGTADPPSLSGVLRPDRQSRFRPAPADTGPDALAELVMKEPKNAWPLSDLACRPPGLKDDDPGATRALNYLGSTDGRIGSDPRSAYALQHFKEASTWDEIARAIEVEKYADVPESRRAQFTETQFLAARCQLVQELRWVANVRLYLEDLASPIADSDLMAYAKIKVIGDTIYEETHPPDESGALHWIELVEILLELAGPVTHEVSSTVAGVMELGVWAFGSDENGGPDNEIPFKTDELGAKMVEQMKDAVKTYDRIGDVIVTDSAKLSFVGTHGNCLPTKDGTCPTGYSFTAADQRDVSADIHRTVERVAYEELLPLGYQVFALNTFVTSAPLGPDSYECGYWPWYYYSDVAKEKAATVLLQDVDPLRRNVQFGSVWQMLVMARPPGRSVHGDPPSDKLLNRMFGRVSPDSTDPEKGGLGMSQARLMSAVEWHRWRPDGSGERDSCHWPPFTDPNDTRWYPR